MCVSTTHPGSRRVTRRRPPRQITFSHPSHYLSPFGDLPLHITHTPLHDTPQLGAGDAAGEEGPKLLQLRGLHGMVHEQAVVVAGVAVLVDRIDVGLEFLQLLGPQRNVVAEEAPAHHNRPSAGRLRMLAAEEAMSRTGVVRLPRSHGFTLCLKSRKSCPQVCLRREAPFAGG